jgi:hypothetical protein
MECQLKSSVSESNLWPLLIDRPISWTIIPVWYNLSSIASRCNAETFGGVTGSSNIRSGHAIGAITFNNVTTLNQRLYNRKSRKQQHTVIGSAQRKR